MPIVPIDAVVTQPLAAAKPAVTPAQEGAGFGELVTRAVENLSSTQAGAESLAVQAATGDLTDVHDYMIAATRATLATELTVAVRNKAVEAFNEIMRMPI